MAGSAVIGALRVNLGLDSAQFSAGLKAAETGLARFSRIAKTGLFAAAAAGAAATTALGVAIKGAIDHADEMSKAAQKTGLTTEALSRLNYAAQFSDVSLQQLSTGLNKLNQNMVLIAQGTGGTAKAAFDALGVSVQGTNGQLRPTIDVLGDLADRFASMPDGPAKTGLAIQALGRAGAELIPLLNGGRASLKAFADEADRTGNTISTATGRQAEELNDSITKLQKSFSGLTNILAAQSLPALNAVAEAMGVVADQFKAISERTFANPLKVQLITLENSMATLRADIKSQQKWIDDQPDWNPLKGINQQQVDEKKKYLEDQYKTASEYQDRINQLSIAANAPPTTKIKPIVISPDTTAAANKAADAYQRVVDRANERIAQSNIEAQALGMTQQAADRLRFANDLLSQATRNGATITGEQRKELLGLADAMAGAEENTRRLSDVYEMGKSVFSNLFSDLKSGLQAGATLWDTLANAASKALDSIADKALSMAANGIWDMIFNAGGGSSGGGIMASLGSLFHFANGTNSAPGGWSVVGERGPELMYVPTGAQVVPNHKMDGAMDGTTIVNLSVDARGAQQGVGPEVAKEVRKVLPVLLADARRRGAVA